MLNIKEDIYSVGVINPNLRIFDIIMKTEHGTSYNAYLVKGEKTALIETVHKTFFDEFIENVEQVMPIEKIDYVVLNHTEPDHSGSLKRLLEINPNITVVASPAGANYLKQITNTQINVKIVRQDDEIDLGGKTLTFINAPFLHWPDSMFTYVKEEKLLFSCDMFGCHYCESNLLDTRIKYPKQYQDAFKYYYDAIFSPFKEYVLKGLAKIEAFDIEVICPSHGPVLTYSIKDVWDKYVVWSTPLTKSDKKKAVIIYASAYGCTKQAAEKIAEGLESVGVTAKLMDVLEHELGKMAQEIEESDAILYGSPTINKDAVKPVWDVFAVTDAIKNAGKLCGVFGSYGWSGEAIKMMEDRAKGLRLKLFEEGKKVNLVPSIQELDSFREYGKAFGNQIK